jgi:hypothetical protein
VDGVKRREKVRVKGQGICFYELEWVTGLWVQIDADNLEARFAVSDACSSCAAEEIEKPWLVSRLFRRSNWPIREHSPGVVLGRSAVSFQGIH